MKVSNNNNKHILFILKSFSVVTIEEKKTNYIISTKKTEFLLFFIQAKTVRLRRHLQLNAGHKQIYLVISNCSFIINKTYFVRVTQYIAVTANKLYVCKEET